MKSCLVLLAFLIFTGGGFGQKAHRDELAVRKIVEKWNDGYRAMDPKAMSSTIADRFDLVNRFGEWISHDNSREEYEKMWAWVFEKVYKGKPGPDHKIENIRRLTGDVMAVQTRGRWEEPITTADGTVIPPFTQWVTFVVVKQPNGWRIASQNIHNQFPNPDRSQNPIGSAAPPTNLY